MLLASERAALVATIDPDAYSAATQTSDWVDLSKYPVLLAVIYAGDLVASATVDAKLEQAKDASGTGAKDITGKAITQLTQAGGDSNKQALINVREDELDVDNGFAFVRLSVTLGVAGGDLAGAIYGFNPSHGFANRNDLASVAQIVN